MNQKVSALELDEFFERYLLPAMKQWMADMDVNYAPLPPWSPELEAAHE